MSTTNLQRSAATLTCHGCKSCLYSAPGGQAWNRQPHSRCIALKVDVPMILGERDKWLGSEVPRDCPEHRQPGLL
jgi:hypothetical protein